MDVGFNVSPTVGFMRGNFSGIGNNEIQEIECAAGNGSRICEFSKVNVTNQGPYLADLYFEVYDTEGNLIEEPVVQVEIVDLVEGDLWNGKVLSCSPRLIDRDTAAQLEHSAFCGLQLTPKAGIA